MKGRGDQAYEGAGFNSDLLLVAVVGLFDCFSRRLRKFLKLESHLFDR